jgi:hypothetical protein
MRLRLISLIPVILVLSGCSSAQEKLPTLAQQTAFPKEFQLGVKTVATYIQRGGEDPSEFHVDVEGPIDGTLVLHLWHKSAFTSEFRNHAVVGNPGGKCRNVTFDLGTNTVLSTEPWQ